MRIWLGWIAAAFWACCLPVAYSDSLPGQEDPAFEAALALWLEDDEAKAMPRLAGLAQDGNVSARLLLGLVGKGTALQGPWLALLPKDKRVALLRAKGGFSGRSWLRQVPEVPVAALMLTVLDGQADIPTALALADFGEARALRGALAALEARQITGFDLFADDPRFPAEMRFLIWRDWLRSGARDADFASAVNGLAKGDPQRILLLGEVEDQALEGWLLKTDLAAPLRALCHQGCPETEGACLRAGMGAIGGYRRLLSDGTPLNALIPEARFAASARGQASVLRRALGFAHLTHERVAEIDRTDACFADLLAREGARF